VDLLMERHNLPHPMADRKPNLEAEAILDQEAKRIMLRWGLSGFKRAYPRLFRVIINSMERYRHGK